MLNMINMLSLYIWVIVFLLIAVIVVIVVIVMRRQFKPIKMHFTYDKKNVKVYRSDFIDKSPDKKPGNPSTGANMDLAVFPLYDDDKNLAGTLHSTASIIKNIDKTNDIFQNITYVLKDGSTISVRLYFKNDENSIFPEESSFKVPIISGTGSYVHKKGTVEIQVNDDGSRDLWIEIVGEY